MRAYRFFRDRPANHPAPSWAGIPLESRLCTSLPSSSSSIRPRSKRMAAEKPESPVLISSLDASRASRLIHRSLSRKSWCRHSVFIRSMASITRPAAWSSQAQAELNNRQNRRNSWPISGFKGWVSRCRMVPNRITRDRLSPAAASSSTAAESTASFCRPVVAYSTSFGIPQ